MLAIVLYILFAVLSTIGAFFIANHFKNRSVALISAVATLAFFVLLFVAITLMTGRLLE
ncbi:MAG: hypothetical protein P8Y44_11010 [Acidobacteriota bacterium]